MSNVRADAVIERIATRAATAARAVRDAREDWERSQENYHADYDARYAIQQERGRRLALAHAIAALQAESALPPERQYRTADGGVDVDGYYVWLGALADAAKAEAGSRTADHGARGAALGYGRTLYELETHNEMEPEPANRSMTLQRVPDWPTTEDTA